MATVALTRVTKSSTLTYNIQDEVWSSSYVADQLFIEMCETNLQNRALELTEPQIRLFNSDKLASQDKTVLHNEVLPVLSYCLRERGELTKKTLESIISQALNSLLPSAEEKIILDTGDNMVVKLLSHKEIYDKVKELAEGMPNRLIW